MSEWWRRLPATAQDTLAGLAMAVAWFVAYDFWRERGWMPVRPETFEVAGLWAAGTLALRRVWPGWVLLAVVAVYPLMYGSTLQTEFHLLPILIAGYSATATGRVRPTVAAAGCMATVLALSSTIDLRLFDSVRGIQPYDWPRLLFTELATVSVVFLGWLMHRHAATAQDLAARNAELERLRQVEAQRVVAEERTRIARELHDVVAHHLTAVIIRAQAADRVRATRPEVATESVGWIADAAKEALAAMRSTVHVLRTEPNAPLALTPGPSLADLRTIAARVGEAGVDVELRLPEPLPALDPQVELAAVRIAQEALTNTMRHAAASRAVVSLRCVDRGVYVDVDDDGTGGPPVAGDDGGNGLVGMRERAAACGGKLRVDASPLGGWRVRAWLPGGPAWK